MGLLFGTKVPFSKIHEMNEYLKFQKWPYFSKEQHLKRNYCHFSKILFWGYPIDHLYLHAPVVVVVMEVEDNEVVRVVVVTHPSVSSQEISWPGSLGQSSSPSHLWTLQIRWLEPGHAIWVSARHPLGWGRGWGIWILRA